MAVVSWTWTCWISHFLLISAVAVLARQPAPTKRNFTTFHVEQVDWTFNHLVVHDKTGHVYLGAVNRIYKLSNDLKVLLTHQTGPEEDNPKCYPPTIVQLCTEPLTVTNNINKMLLIDYKENRLIACGSLYQGICKLLRLDDLFKLGEPFHRKEHYLSGVNESGSVFGVIVSHSKLDDKLFLATAVDGKPEYFPTISSRKLTKHPEDDGMFAYVFHDEFVASMIKIPSDTFTIIPDFDIYYIYGFSSGNHVYFLTLQPEMTFPQGSTTKEQVYTSKLVRLCKEDAAFNSYVEVPIGCEKNGVEYRLLQAAYLSKAGAILARSLGVGPNDDVLFAVFSKGQKRRVKSLDETALCVFVLKEINDRIKERLKSCYKGEGTLDLAWLKVKDIPCSSALLSIDDNFCGLDMNAPLGVSKMVRGFPVFTEDKDRMTSVIAYVYKDHSLAFVGTKSGKLKKIRVSGPTNGALQYEIIQVVDDAPILRDMAFSVDHEQLYIMSEKQLARVPVESCGQYSTCSSCLGSGDPHCGWCVLHNTCTRKERCERSHEPRRFASDMKQCVRLTVHPNNISVSQYNVLLVLEAYNVPELSAGVSCTFEDLSELDGMVVGNQIRCISPAEKEVPRIITENGDHHTVQLQLKSKETGMTFASTNFVFYNCSVHNSCLSCVESPYQCHWCKYRHVCTHDPRTCSFQEGRVKLSELESTQGGSKTTQQEDDTCKGQEQVAHWTVREGDHVLLRNFNRSWNSPRFTGPHQIEKVTTRAVKLKDKQVWTHQHDIKPNKDQTSPFVDDRANAAATETKDNAAATAKEDNTAAATTTKDNSDTAPVPSQTPDTPKDSNGQSPTAHPMVTRSQSNKNTAQANPAPAITQIKDIV